MCYMHGEMLFAYGICSIAEAILKMQFCNVAVMCLVARELFFLTAAIAKPTLVKVTGASLKPKLPLVVSPISMTAQPMARINLADS